MPSSSYHPARSEDRFPVHISVRFLDARDYLIQYAENLSQGGLFVAGAQALKPLNQVDLEIELPGYGRFPVEARVAHVVTERMAEERGQTAGAGLAFVNVPDNFERVLSQYLQLLGRRHDTTVLVQDEGLAVELGRYGYRCERAESADKVVAQVMEMPSVIAVVVSPEELAKYRIELIRAELSGELAIAVGGAHGAERLVRSLDPRVVAITS